MCTHPLEWAESRVLFYPKEGTQDVAMLTLEARCGLCGTRFRLDGALLPSISGLERSLVCVPDAHITCMLASVGAPWQGKAP